jgi:hypothetical protein
VRAQVEPGGIPTLAARALAMISFTTSVFASA